MPFNKTSNRAPRLAVFCSLLLTHLILSLGLTGTILTSPLDLVSGLAFSFAWGLGFAVWLAWL
ncbi:MAG: hypothetical protein OIF54_16200, partial [Cohaesibacter sp.]|nr:hypothetical protein [Cohaesibacter sp.]